MIGVVTYFQLIARCTIPRECTRILPRVNHPHTQLEVQCGTKFLRVLIFAGFVAIRKNKFPQNKITANFFSAKIYSTVEIIYKNTDLKEKMP